LLSHSTCVPLRRGAEPVDRMHDDIQLLIVRSLLSVANTIVQDKHCFELYGYDIILAGLYKHNSNSVFRFPPKPCA
jgi:hypothetical protein